MADPANITVLNSSTSWQMSLSGKGADSDPEDIKGGAYTRQLMRGLDNKKTLWESHLEATQFPFKGQARGKNIRPTPLHYGAPIPKGFMDPNVRNKGSALIIVGAGDNSSLKDFNEDAQRAAKKYKEMGYNVHVVHTREDYNKALKVIEAEGSKEKGDGLIVHFTGHGDTTDDVIHHQKSNNPEMEGVFFMKRHPDQVVERVYEGDGVLERDLMPPIAKVAKQFDHTVVVFDSCYAGAMDTQFLQDKSFPRPRKGFSYRFSDPQR